MKILHTSDWHLGHQFHSRRRETEFEQFLNWLLETIRERRIDALIVAGDLFDSSAPSNAAMRLYCDFLLELQSTPCRLAVLTGGNHDSPSFLNAPRELLKAAFPIEIFGGAAKPEQELVVLRDRNGDPELIVGAVPYLRDGDLTMLSFGEATAEREKKTGGGNAGTLPGSRGRSGGAPRGTGDSGCPHRPSVFSRRENRFRRRDAGIHRRNRSV